MILVTGGAGYIGSHTVVELLLRDFDVVVVDNLTNSARESLARVQVITGRSVKFIEGDIRDRPVLRDIFQKFTIQAVIHFAGLKAVGESVENPVLYYDNNVGGSVSLIEVMSEYNCKNLVFSSSATVYGDPMKLPLDESCPTSTTNPYGTTKLVVENFLREVSQSDNDWSVVVLRYFNPVGAHASGMIGENPIGSPNNLMPYVAQVAAGVRESVTVFGNDYGTVDGTGVRDYIHVVDLARGHICALNALLSSNGVLTVNLGTGRGYSVLEVISAFEKASNRSVPFVFADRRAGDVAECFADPSFAKQVLGWEAQLDLDSMCADAWRWQSMNPTGYTKDS